jgi:hypothetical protein
MDGMKIRVIADVVLSERADDVVVSSLLEHSRLFADQLECREDPTLREHFRQALRGIVVRREKVILRVEPEDDVDGWNRFFRRTGGRDRE